MRDGCPATPSGKVLEADAAATGCARGRRAPRRWRSRTPGAYRVTADELLGRLRLPVVGGADVPGRGPTSSSPRRARASSARSRRRTAARPTSSTTWLATIASGVGARPVGGQPRHAPEQHALADDLALVVEHRPPVVISAASARRGPSSNRSRATAGSSWPTSSTSSSPARRSRRRRRARVHQRGCPRYTPGHLSPFRLRVRGARLLRRSRHRGAAHRGRCRGRRRRGRGVDLVYMGTHSSRPPRAEPPTTTNGWSSSTALTTW